LIEHPMDRSKSFSRVLPARTFFTLFFIMGIFGIASGSVASFILPWNTSLF
jgi:hypothetical protein